MTLDMAPKFTTNPRTPIVRETRHSGQDTNHLDYSSNLPRYVSPPLLPAPNPTMSGRVSRTVPSCHGAGAYEGVRSTLIL
jgi:hypothetical protein